MGQINPESTVPIWTRKNASEYEIHHPLQGHPTLNVSVDIRQHDTKVPNVSTPSPTHMLLKY